MSASGGPSLVSPVRKGSPRRIIKKIIEDEEIEDANVEGGVALGPLKDIFTLRPTELALKIFGPEVVGKWENSGTGTTSAGKKRLLKIRDIWELTSAGAQCNNTVGPIGGETVCWICGIGIPLRPTKRQIGYAGQCEHILPIAQGVMIWSLYGSKDKGDAEFKEYLKLEYDWAHTICNQVKSAMILLTPSADGTACSVDNSRVNGLRPPGLLAKIYSSTRADSSSLRSELSKKYGSIKSFVDDRGPYVKARLMPMVTIINQNIAEWGSKLVTLTAVAKAKGRAVESIRTFDDIADVINSEQSPIIIPISQAEREAAPVEEPFTEEISEAEEGKAIETFTMLERQGMATLLNLKYDDALNKLQGRGRKTRRRKERLFHKLGRKTKHRKRYHAMRMSSRRHSLSGKAARR
jgi:hypothetical protein